jgi:hypothetical protein
MPMPDDVAQRLARMFMDRGFSADEKPEIRHRNTSVPKDYDAQHRVVLAFLLPYFEEVSPGAGLNPCIRVWMGRIPMEKLAAACREIERGYYRPDVPGDTRSDLRWPDLSHDRQMRTILAVLNEMLRRY